jgi:hypothetical protein
MTIKIIAQTKKSPRPDGGQPPVYPWLVDVPEDVAKS